MPKSTKGFELPLPNDIPKVIVSKPGGIKTVLKKYGDALSQSHSIGRAQSFRVDVDPEGHTTVMPLSDQTDVAAAPDNSENNALETALNAARERGRVLVSGILNSPQMLAADDFAELLHTTRVTVNTQRKSGRLLGLEGATRGFRFPTWQLNEEGKPYRELASLHDLLGGAWPVFRFLTYPQAELGGSTGRAALEQGRGAEVLKAAESVGRDFS